MFVQCAMKGFQGELDMDEQLAELDHHRPRNLKLLGMRGPQRGALGHSVAACQ